MWPEDLSAEYHLYAVLFCVFVGLVYWNNESSRCLGLAENFLSLLKIICRQFVAPDFFCSAHRACCVKGTGFRILISEKGKQAAFFFLPAEKVTTASLWLFFTWAQQKLKEEGAAVNIWLIVQCEQAVSSYLSVSQEIHRVPNTSTYKRLIWKTSSPWNNTRVKNNSR